MNYQYRAQPFIGRLKGKQGADEVSRQLESVINTFAVDGWEFYQLADVNFNRRLCNIPEVEKPAVLYSLIQPVISMANISGCISLSLQDFDIIADMLCQWLCDPRPPSIE